MTIISILKWFAIKPLVRGVHLKVRFLLNLILQETRVHRIRLLLHYFSCTAYLPKRIARHVVLKADSAYGIIKTRRKRKKRNGENVYSFHTIIHSTVLQIHLFFMERGKWLKNHTHRVKSKHMYTFAKPPACTWPYACSYLICLMWERMRRSWASRRCCCCRERPDFAIKCIRVSVILSRTRWI